MPSGFAAFNSANTAAISSAFLSAISGFVLYLINVRFIVFSMTWFPDDLFDHLALPSAPKNFVTAKRFGGRK